MRRLVPLAALVALLLLQCAPAWADVAFQATAQPVAGNIVQDVAVGDLDGRNGPDIVTSYYEGGLGVQLNDGTGHFGPPHLYPTGCDTVQVELADLGASNTSNVPDGKLDAAVVCVYNSGDQQYLGRLTGDGNGGFSEARVVPELTFGSFNGAQPQEMALTDIRAPGLPPVPAFSYLYEYFENFEHKFHELICFTYDWETRTCGNLEDPSPGPLFVAGKIADARLFTLGGTQGILDWGPEPVWHASTRDLAPDQPSTAGNFKAITVGDLAGDGPDLISSSGSCGCGYQDYPAAGVVDVNYGDIAGGVPEQHGTVIPSAPGVINIATGDFDLDGHTDLVGTSFTFSPASGPAGSVFVQSGDGAGHLGSPQMIPLATNESFSKAPVRVADLDGNGTADVVAIVGGKVEVLLNQKVPVPRLLAPVTPIGPNPINPLTGIHKLTTKVTVGAGGVLIFGTATNPPTAAVNLTLSIPAKAAAGSALAAFGPTLGGKKAKGPKKRPPVVIGAGTVTIPTGTSRPLRIKLNRKGDALLRKGPAHATLTIVATGTDGEKATRSSQVTIKLAKKATKKSVG